MSSNGYTGSNLRPRVTLRDLKNECMSVRATSDILIEDLAVGKRGKGKNNNVVERERKKKCELTVCACALGVYINFSCLKFHVNRMRVCLCVTLLAGESPERQF